MGKKKVKVKKAKEKNGGFVSAIKGSWKILLSIGVALSLVGSIFTFDGRYFKTVQAEQQKQEVVKSFENLNKSFQIQQEQLDQRWKKQNIENQLNDLIRDERRLYDRERQLKKDAQRFPKDTDSKQELEEIQKDRDDVKRQILDLKNQLNRMK